MTLAWLKIIAGEAPLPEEVIERANLVEFADAHHVLGQMATVWGKEAPGKLKDVLENGLLRTGFDHRMLEFEMDRLERALEGSGIVPVLLKGAAYVATGAKAGEGRRVADIDILVGEDELEETEKLLSVAGWAFDLGVDNDYDLYYYRKYMHELPPLRHGLRRTIIDVHHSLLPRTSRIQIKNEKFREQAVVLKGRALKALQPVDLFIHSAVHSFADGSFDTPARSILELHYLLADLSEQDRTSILGRAASLGATMPVSTALWVLAHLFGDAQADTLLKDAAKKQVKLVSAPVRYAIEEKLNRIETAYLAKFILFVRSHFLRMPLRLLLAHLARKFFRKLKRLIIRKAQ